MIIITKIVTLVWPESRPQEQSHSFWKLGITSDITVKASAELCAFKLHSVSGCILLIICICMQMICVALFFIVIHLVTYCMQGKYLSTSTVIHRLIHVLECKIFLFEHFKMFLNNRNWIGTLFTSRNWTYSNKKRKDKK